MKTSRPRLRVLATLFLLALGFEAVQLYLLMVEQNDTWVERSYRNRWAFKDVPTRRGAIVDRHGEALVEDRPCLSLHLHYRVLRRRHPVGQAVHGANLWMQVRGIGDDLFRFDDDVNGPERACEQLLQLPVQRLSAQEIGREASRDLRFYVSGLLANLTRGSRGKIARQLREAIADGGAQTVADVLGAADGQRARATFATRLAELEGFDRALRASSAQMPLLSLLERHRQQRWDDVEREDRVVLLYDKVSFEVGLHLGFEYERHPGLHLRQSVDRRTAEAVARTPSLSPLLGTVSPYWEADVKRLQRHVGAVMDEATQGAGPVADLPEDVAEAVESRAARALLGHYIARGRRGRGGVEGAMDDRLSGQPGLRWVERDKSAREKKLWNQFDVAPGEEVALTIDIGLQRLLDDAFDAVLRDPAERLDAAREIAVAVLDPSTGDILAMGGRPLLLANKPRSLSPAVSWGRGVGYVGSVAKPFVLIEYLETLARRPELRHFRDFDPCVQRYKRIPGTRRYLSCSGHHGALACDCSMALAKSCNFFYYQAAEQLGREGLERAYRRAGWLVGSGDGPQRNLARAAGTSWSPPLRGLGAKLLALQGIGYGVEVNALLVARAYAGLATGILPSVSLVRGDRDSEPRDLGIDATTRGLVLDGMRACVTEGTARGIPVLVELGVLGKTGTAEISSDNRNNAWFAGFTTRRRPTLAFAAVAYDVPDAEHGGEGTARLIARFLEATARDDVLRARYLPEVEAR